jgi:hypothetical protein
VLHARSQRIAGVMIIAGLLVEFATFLENEPFNILSRSLFVRAPSWLRPE